MQRQLPADQPRQRLHRGLVERQVGERAETRDPGRVAVVALGLGADHGGLDAARAALEDHAVAVDEEVVADVVPAVGVAVVARDAEDDRSRLLGRVVDGADGVVHERDLHVAVAGAAARWHAVAAPARARDDRGRARLACGRARPARRRVGERAHEARLQAAGAAAQPQLELVGAAGEDGVGAVAVAGVVVRQRRPARPAPAVRARADLRLRGGRPSAQTRPSRSKRRGAGSTWSCASRRRRRARRACRCASSNSAGSSAARAGEGRRSAPSAAAPAPRRTAWRRVRRGPSISGFEHSMAAIGAFRALERDLPVENGNEFQ